MAVWRGIVIDDVDRGCCNGHEPRAYNHLASTVYAKIGGWQRIASIANQFSQFNTQVSRQPRPKAAAPDSGAGNVDPISVGVGMR